MVPAPTAAVIVVGNELLSGKVQEANLLVLARELRVLGVRLRRVVIVEDDTEGIAREVRALSSAFDWVFTSGGVGPTHDDVTLAAVARAFDVPIERRAELAAMLRAFYGERCTEGHLRMADVPRGMELVRDFEGEPDLDSLSATDGAVIQSGAGGSMRPKATWPALVLKNVFVLPGIPQVFQMKMPAVRAKLRHTNAPSFVTRAVLTNMDEGHLKPLLDAVVAQFPEVEVGSYPAWHGATYRTKLTFDGRDPDRIEAARDAFCRTLPAGEPLGYE